MTLKISTLRVICFATGHSKKSKNIIVKLISYDKFIKLIIKIFLNN